MLCLNPIIKIWGRITNDSDNNVSISSIIIGSTSNTTDNTNNSIINSSFTNINENMKGVKKDAQLILVTMNKKLNCFYK